jgi:hypothetical protein
VENVGIASHIGKYEDFPVTAAMDKATGSIVVTVQLCEKAPCHDNPAPGILSVSFLIYIFIIIFIIVYFYFYNCYYCYHY